MNHFLSFVDDRLLVVLWDATLKSTLLLALAGAAALAARRASAAARHMIFSAALFGTLLLPALSLLLPEWRVPWIPQWLAAQALFVNDSQSPIESVPFERPAPALSEKSAAPDMPRTEAQPRPVRVATARSNEFANSAVVQSTESKPIRDAQRSLVQIFAAVWFAGLLLSLSPLTVGTFLLARLTRRSTKHENAAWNSLAAGLSAQLGLTRPAALRTNDRIRSPLTWGAWRPIILLPSSVDNWSAERRRIVLLHELAHVKRFDWLTQSLAYIACSIYWFNPLAWWAAHRMRIEREGACDDAVLAAGSRPADYADELLKLATLMLSPSPGGRGSSLVDWAAVPMARRSTLEGRLLAILDGTRNRAALTRAVLAATVIVLISVAIPIAMMRAAPQKSNVSSSTTGGEASDPIPESSPHFELLAVERFSETSTDFWAPDGTEIPSNVARVLTRISKSAPPTLSSNGSVFVLNILVRRMPSLDQQNPRHWIFEVNGGAREPELLTFESVSELNGKLIRFVANNIPLNQRTLTARCGFSLADTDQVAEFRNLALRPKESTSTDVEPPFETIEKQSKTSRKFVLVVAGPGALTFEGQSTTWEQLPDLLAKVPDRAHTVLELAVSSDDFTMGQLNELQGRAQPLAKQFGFEYLSFVGIHQLGAKSASSAAPPPLPPESQSSHPIPNENNIPWGEPIGGQSVRLHGQQTWQLGQAIRLSFDIRNQSERETIPLASQYLSHLDVNGKVYQWHVPLMVSGGPLASGEMRKDVPVDLPGEWVDLEGKTRLQLPVGKYVVRLLVPSGIFEGTPPQSVYIRSNPFLVQVIDRAASSTDSSDNLRQRIERLIQGAPVSSKYPEIAIFEQVAGTPGEYRIRADVARRTVLPDGGPLSFVPLGVVYYQTDQNRFYIQWDGMGASTLHYYGPFAGDPADVLGFPVPKPAGEPPDTTYEERAFANAPWGEAVQGVSARLRADIGTPTAEVFWAGSIFAPVRSPGMPIWTPNDVPELWLWIRNSGTRDWDVPAPQFTGELEFDGKWYTIREIGSQIGASRLQPGTSSLGHIEVLLSKQWLAKEGDTQLPLTVGRHTVRFAFTVEARNGQEPKSIRIVTNAVTLPIVGPAPGAEQLAAIRRGEPINGVSIQLKQVVDIIPAGNPASPAPLMFSVRNQGTLELSVGVAQVLGELEVDNQWYKWTGPIGARSGYFPPGKEYSDMPITFSAEWRSKEGDAELHLDAGKHTIRFATSILPARPLAVPAEPGSPQPFRVKSNALEIKVTEPNSGPHLPWGPANGGLQIAAHMAKANWSANETPQLVVSLKNDSGKTLNYLGRSAAECRVKIDGKWFGNSKLLEIGAKLQDLASGQIALNAITVLLDGDQWAEVNDPRDWPLVGGQGRGEKLTLTPGKHTVTVMFQSVDRPNSPDDSITPQSNSLEFTIEPPTGDK